MTLSEGNSNTGQGNKKLSIIMFILLLLVIVGVAFFVYLKSQNIDIRNINLKQPASGNIFSGSQDDKQAPSLEIKFDPKVKTAFTVYRDYLIECTTESIKALDIRGERQWEIPITINSPFIRATPSELLVTDIGGKDIYVISGNRIKWKARVDSRIINADISESGYVTVIKEEKGYKGVVKVFDPKGNEIVTIGREGSYIISAKVSPSGNRICLNRLDTSGVNADSILEFTDISGRSIAAKLIQEDAIFPSIWYMDKDFLLAVGDSVAVCFDMDRNEKWKQDYTGKKVYSSKVSLGKYAVIAAGSGNITGIAGDGHSEVSVFNSKGQKAGSYKLDDEVLNIETYSDMIAVNTGKEVHFINTRGKLLGKYTSKGDVSYVCFFDKQEAAVIMKNSVVIIKI